MADMNLSIRIENLDKVREALGRLSGAQAKQAYANAINDAAFKAQAAMRAELRSNFDRVTPFIAGAPKVFKATADDLTASIRPTLDTRKVWSKGGKVGVDPQDVLQAQEFGGRRRDKRSEVVLRRAGWLPDGYQTVIPDTPFPGSDDGRGNLKGKFLQSVLSFLQTYQGGQGFKQNMNASSVANVKQYGRGKITKRQKEQAGPFMGRTYFIAGGRAAVTWDNQKYRIGASKTAHLQPGIWAAMGVGKSRQLRPVLMFARAGTYRPRISMDRVVKSMQLQDYLDRRVRRRIRNLAEGKLA